MARWTKNDREALARLTGRHSAEVIYARALAESAERGVAGRPKIPFGRNISIWSVVAEKVAARRISAKRASEYVVADCVRLLPDDLKRPLGRSHQRLADFDLSAERVRKIYAAVELERAENPDFDEWCASRLELMRARAAETPEGGSYIFLPLTEVCSAPDASPDANGTIFLRKGPKLS
jgi:hypothetical protein